MSSHRPRTTTIAPFDEMARLLASIRHVHGPAASNRKPADVVVVCMVRNGAAFVRPFIEHYRALGAAHMVFLDNGSTDGTGTLLKRFPDVTVLHSAVRVGHNEVLIKRYLANRFSADCWCLLADIDEFFHYPFPGAAGLSALVQYLRANSYTAVVAQMLDLFSDRPLDELRGRKRALKRDDYRQYDLSDIRKLDYFDAAFEPLLEGNTVGHAGIKFYRGGIRKALFGSDNWLTKHPLFLPGAAELTSTHCLRRARCADFTAACLHYKFVGDFHRRTRAYVKRGYGPMHDEYQAILRVKPRPRLFLDRPAARRLEGMEELLERGFLVASKRYIRWARRRSTP